MLEFAVLASGSAANSIYLRSESEQVLVDCGLSAKQTEIRLRAIGVDPASISSVVISHEHSDHVQGLPVFAKRYGTKVYMNRSTFLACPKLGDLPEALFCFFKTGESFILGDIEFSSFSIPHDAVDPVGFSISSAAGASLSIVTDLGRVTEIVRSSIRGAQALILESNHCPVLLEESEYPWSLKQRISSNSGHLSNQSAGDLLTEFSNSLESQLEIVVAAHISQNSNRPERALAVLLDSWQRGEKGQQQIELVAASAGEATRMFRIER